MKFTKLRNILIRNIIIYLIVFVVIGLIYSQLVDKRDSDAQKRDMVQNEVTVLDNKLNALNKKVSDVKEATKLWQRLNEKNKKREGLKIDSIKKILDDLKKRYKLVQTDADIDLSTPVELADIYKTETTVVVASKVTLKFRTITDEYAFSYVDALMKELPGYVKIQNLLLTRTNTPLTDDLLQRISKGEIPELVEGSITFDWRDLKDVSNVKSNALSKPKDEKKAP